MFSSILKKVFGTANDRLVKKLRKEIEQINELEAYYVSLSDEELKNQTDKLKLRLEEGETLDDIIYDAFALVREASKRTLKMRHFNEQLIGGLVLHRGIISEMKTGEGKTLVATLPAYLNALSEKGVHIVTVNDYLAQRDAKWMGEIFNFLGLSVGCISNNTPDDIRKKAYNSDITYATNNELGFDFLRDNMKFDINTKVQRELNYCIIDEVDSILIDEARTPLIISGPVNDKSDLYVAIDNIIKYISEEYYDKDEKVKSVSLNDQGISKVEELLIKYKIIKPDTNLYDIDNMSLVHYVNQALRAHVMFHKDVDYIIRSGQVMIIDEFTGRIMEGRRYSEGLHQALEAKEGVKIKNENQTLASITFQNYFRMYKKIAGMTGTAMTEAAELKDIYDLDVISIPPHKPLVRKDHDDEIYGTKPEKYDAILNLVKDCYKRGQPMLIGTVSIEKSEEISSLLKTNKVKHNVLNAKNHEKEAHIIAQAGRFKAVTIATNMAGRGTDIMLGGNVEMLIEEQMTEDADYNKLLKKITKQVENEKKKVIEAGGLFVIGTERHESRRIDNQLRGRSGRQGDPGNTKFFLSLEDDLMRIFASDRISGLLRGLGLKGGEAIHHPMISRALAKAQQRVEGQNYEIRRNLLKFDDVMNEQRKIVYKQREDIILSDHVDDMLFKMMKEWIQNSVFQHIPQESLPEEWNSEGLAIDINKNLGIHISPETIMNTEGAEEGIISYIQEQAEALFKSKYKQYGEKIMQSAAKYILLGSLDYLWKDHLHNLDHLRQGISLRAYGQKDPLNEYKREAFELFENMLNNVKEIFLQRIAYLHIDPKLVEDRLSLKNKKLQEMHQTRKDPALNKYHVGDYVESKLKPIQARINPKDRNPDDPSTWGKILRNEQCPCGSNKKYKHCHGSATDD